MAQDLAKNESALQLMAIGILAGDASPTGITAKKGSLYINRIADSPTTRLYINTDGGTTWAGVTCSA